MLLVTKQMLAAGAAERYREANQWRGEWLPPTDGRDPQTIYRQLQALSHDTDAEKVTEITGDPRWTANSCDECGQDCETVVLVAIEMHHPTDMTALCPDCLRQALRLATP